MTDALTRRNRKKTFNQLDFATTSFREKIEIVDSQFKSSDSTKNIANIQIVISNTRILTSDNDNDVDYEALTKTEYEKQKRLQAKQKYKIAVTKIKQLKVSLTIEKTTSTQRRSRVRKIFEKNSNDFEIPFDFSFEKKVRSLKKQRFFLALKLINLDLYTEKNFKKYQN